ncbi:MAG: hypothetical protein RE469_04415 [Cuniculiplasma divulgatum]|nr:MAG: hypothetical protein RE469_04415 [Cuniculiplasma divulgatum]
MFIELLNNEIFKAKNLATNKNSLCAVTFDSSIREVNDALYEASPGNGDYDNIIVNDGDRLMGFIPREQLEANRDNISRRKHMTKKFENYTLSAEESVRSIVERIYVDFEKTGSSNAYLVKNDDEELGIMTYADFNRRSVYIYNYVIILFLEQWLKENISKTFVTKYRKISINWMKSLDQKRTTVLTKRSKEKDESTLAVASIDDLITVFKKESALQYIRNKHRETLPDKTLADIVSMRPKVMHPTKLLIPKCDIKSGLLRLVRISRLVDDFIRYEDSNKKNQGWPNVL